MQPQDLFYNIARENKRIKSFVYGKAYEKGAGNNVYPLIWMDDPISGNTAGVNPQPLSLIQWVVNCDILGIPVNDADVLTVQATAFAVGLSVAERIRKIYPTTKYSISAFNFISLRDYYDDNAAGYRFTYTIAQSSPADICADDYDPDKEFINVSPLPDFSTASAEGCAVFTNKTGLPNFSVE